MKKAVIVGAGLATRLYPITHHIPKVLVNFQQHTILKHLHDLYSDLGADQIHLIIHSKFAHTTMAYCKQMGIKVTIHCVDEAYGSAYAINQMAGFFNGHNVIFNWCDVIPEFDKFSWGEDAIYTFGDQCRFNYDENGLKEVGATGGNVVGVYQMAEFYENSLEKDEANEYFKGKDFIEFSAHEFECTESTELANLIDLGDKPKLINAHKGVIPREFNKIEMTESTVKKIAVNEQGVRLQRDELFWYDEISSSNVPKILQSNESSFTMERIHGKPMYEAFEDTGAKTKLLKRILKEMHFSNEQMSISVHHFEEDLRYEVIDKVLARCESIQDLIDSFGKIERVNGVRIGRLKPMLHQAFRHLFYHMDAKYTKIHGDTNFSNIMLSDDDQIKFIDPRGYFGKTKVWGPKMYDECKVLYALSGYDRFNSDPEWGGLTILNTSARVDIQPLMRFDTLPEFNDMHQLWVAVIWVALGGYFKNNPLKAVSAYYYGMYLLTTILRRLGRRLENNEVSFDDNYITTSVLKTRNPGKWLLTDLETGQEYRPGHKTGHDWELVK